MDDLTRKHLQFHDTPCAMVAMEVDYPDGATTGWHAHPRDQLLYAIEGVMIVRSAVGFWIVPPSRALWLVAGLEHEVKMSGQVKIRTVFIDTTTIQAPSGKELRHRNFTAVTRTHRCGGLRPARLS